MGASFKHSIKIKSNKEYENDTLQPSPVRFRSSACDKGFAPLAEYVHSPGLKFDIYIMRGIPRKAAGKTLSVGLKAHGVKVYRGES